ncbi:MAG TPA: fatty acid desaturase [Spongiibacteraceae bacterium]|nr:fatty acid desaturase [Spongiibacteraceae bacterium]
MISSVLNLSLRHDDALLPTSAALLYVAAMYCGGFALLFHATWWSWPLGALAVAHSMVIAAYLVHECAHNAIFKESKHNAALGRLLLWINGACYGDYEAIRHKHMRHHIDRADVIAIDYRELLLRHGWLRRIALALEALYVPAIDCLMHFLVMALPFTSPDYRAQRRRVLFCSIIRGSLLALLLWFAWPAFVGYLFAYLLFEIVMRTMDMHQHTFEVFINLNIPREKVHFDKDYEQRNTFSNTLGRGVLLNLLVLNFGYHNAHHEKPTAPWYRLPALDKALFGDDATQTIPFLNIVKGYSKYRLMRVMNADHGDQAIGSGPDKGLGFVGVLGVSFLTAI